MQLVLGLLLWKHQLHLSESHKYKALWIVILDPDSSWIEKFQAVFETEQWRLLIVAHHRTSTRQTSGS